MNLYKKILFILKNEKEFITMKDMNVTPVYFYNTVSQLLHEGLVEARSSKDDKRIKEYFITQKGKKECEKPRGFFL